MRFIIIFYLTTIPPEWFMGIWVLHEMINTSKPSGFDGSFKVKIIDLGMYLLVAWENKRYIKEIWV